MIVGDVQNYSDASLESVKRHLQGEIVRLTNELDRVLDEIAERERQEFETLCDICGDPIEGEPDIATTPMPARLVHAECLRQEIEDGRCWMEEQRNGNLHGRNVL